jgi:hypothetical protein
LARLWKNELTSALEWYRGCKPAFPTGGIHTDEEVKEFLVEEAQALKLTDASTKVFDFSLQRAVNKELGIKQ